MLAVGWLTGRRGWMMQVLQCGSPADGVEGRSYHQLWHSTQGHLPAAEAVAAGGQGQGDGRGGGGAVGQDGGIPEGGRVGSAGVSGLCRQ